MKYVRGDEYALSRVYTNLSIAYYMRSMYGMALDMLERSESISNRSGEHLGVMKCLLNKSAIYYATGRNAEAKEVLLRTLDMARRSGHKQLIAGVSAALK
jgi:tetratricopeptide (TPR) repeat protein